MALQLALYGATHGNQPSPLSPTPDTIPNADPPRSISCNAKAEGAQMDTAETHIHT